MVISSEDVKMIEKFIEIRNKGYYADGKQLTELYNRVLEKHANVTQCGSCLRQRVQELSDALDRFKRLQSLKEEEKPVEQPANKPQMTKSTGGTRTKKTK